jgi:hypothetical protein
MRITMGLAILAGEQLGWRIHENVGIAPAH